MATKEELRAGAEFGFIDDGVEAQERYQPMLLTNQAETRFLTICTTSYRLLRDLLLQWRSLLKAD